MGFNIREFLNLNNKDKQAPQPASTATPVQQKIATAKYGVLANNPQAQQQFTQDIQPVQSPLWKRAVSSVSHNPVTDITGNLVVKPFIINPAQNVIETGRGIAADITGNVAAQNAGRSREWKNVQESLPGAIVSNAYNIGKAYTYDLGKQTSANLTGNDIAAQHANDAFLQDINRSAVGNLLNVPERQLAKYQVNRDLPQLSDQQRKAVTAQNLRNIDVNPDANMKSQLLATTGGALQLAAPTFGLAKAGIEGTTAGEYLRGATFFDMAKNAKNITTGLVDRTKLNEPLAMNNPDGARTTGFEIKNNTGAPLIERPKPGFQVNDPYNSTGLKINNPNNVPIVGENLSGAAQQSHLSKTAELAHQAAHTGEIKNPITGEWIPAPNPKEGGYLSFGGSDKTTPEQHKAEVINRLKQASIDWETNKNTINDISGKGPNSVKTQNNKMFKEFNKNPDAFVEKYGLVEPTKVVEPPTKPQPAQKTPKPVQNPVDSSLPNTTPKDLPIVGPDLSKKITKPSQAVNIEQPIPQESIKSPKVQGNSASSANPSIPPVANDVQGVLQGKQVKERGFAKTVREAPKTPNIEAIDNNTYVVKSDKQRIKDARDYIKADPTKAEQVALNPQNDMHVTIGNQLLDHYIATGQIEKFRKLNSGMAASGTELGRAVHAFADYIKTTPSGAVKFAEKTVRQYNKLNPDKKLNLSNEDITGLVSKAQEVQKMKAGKARNIAEHQLLEQVNNLIPSTVADKAITVWKAGLLTSPRTTARNITGNTIHGVSEIIKDIPASLNDMLLKQRTRERSLTFTTKGELSGAKKGLTSGKDIMKFGFDPTHSIDKYDVRHVTWADTPVQQALKKYTDFVFHAMGAQDQPFYHAAFRRSLYDQAGALAKNAGKSGDSAFIKNLVDHPTEKMVVNATKDASTATFKDPNALRDIAGEFKQTLGKTETGKVISEVVAPFTGVPSSIAGQVLAYSPVGLVKGISKDIKVLTKNLPELQRQASQEIGRGVVGTGIAGIGAYLTAKGLMTGNPKDADEARQWELEGKQPNSVLIGGKWRSVNSIGPEALVLLAGSKIESGVKNKEGFGKVAGNLGKDFTQQTFLRGVQGPLNAISDPGRYGETYFKGQAASVIPNIVKDTAKAFDPTQRETNSVGDAMKAGVPGLRNTLLPKRDALGNPLKQEPTGANAFFDLFNSKTPIKNDIVNELSRLHSNDQNATPPKLKNKATIGGTKTNLSDKQRNDLEKSIGGTTSKGYSQFIKTPQYSGLNDEQKKTILDDYRSDITTVEKQKYAADSQIGPYAPDSTGTTKGLTARQQKILDGSITIDDYIKKTKPTTPKSTTSSKKSTVTRQSSSTKRSGGRATKSKYNYTKSMANVNGTANISAIRNLVKGSKIVRKRIKA